MLRVDAPELGALLGKMAELDASDLFLTVGLPPTVFVNERFAQYEAGETALVEEQLQFLDTPIEFVLSHAMLEMCLAHPVVGELKDLEGALENN